MRILVLGAGGIVGRALVQAAAGRHYEVYGFSHAELDLLDSQAIEATVADLRPELVANCAAWTAVDACEADPSRAFAINANAVRGLATACDRLGARLLQISTDYIFNGRSQVPYREEDPPEPLSVYGASKLLGERFAAEAPRTLVVRTSWIFGEGGRNFVDTIAEHLSQPGDPLRVVDDQVGCPTYAPFLAEALLDLGECGAEGTLHYRNREPTSWYGFAQTIRERMRAAREVVPARTDEVPRPARRPAYSVLDVSRTEALLGRRVECWELGLARHLKERQER